MSKTPIDTEFYADLRKLRKKYPMVFLSAWTPDDFHSVTDFDADESDADWSDPYWKKVACQLSKRFDSVCGVNWEFIRYVIHDLND